MQQFVRTALWLCAALFISPGVVTADAADRKVTLLQGTDLEGFDYSIIKGTTLDACQAACTDDRICRAFTFNQKANWCFLKGSVGQDKPFTAATSGRIGMAPSPEVIAASRQSDLPFPADDLIDSARQLASGMATSDTPPKGLTYADLVAAGDDAANQSNPAGATVSYRQALAIVGNDPALWLKLADMSLMQADAAAEASQDSSS